MAFGKTVLEAVRWRAGGGGTVGPEGFSAGTREKAFHFQGTEQGAVGDTQARVLFF